MNFDLYFRLFLLLLGSVRLLRWLGLWQQKEYRLDRYGAFLKSSQGINELKNLVHLPFSWQQVKRPKPTLRASLNLLSSISLYIFILWLGLIPSMIGYLTIPVLVVIGGIPLWLLTTLVSQIRQAQARSLIKQAKPEIIGVTGSYGKTTTKHLLAQLLQEKSPVWFTPKSHNTPYSIAQAILTRYRQQPVVIIEYASYKLGEIDKLAKQYQPDLAVFTGLNQQHLATFGSMAKMKQAESELFAHLPKSAQVFYNDTDKLASQVIENYPADLQLLPASDLELKFRLDSDLQLEVKIDNNWVKTKLIGLHYQNNIRLAVAVGRSRGLTWKQIATRLESFEPDAEFIRWQQYNKQVRLIIDDRTSNPTGFAAGLDLLSQAKAKSRWCLTSGIIDLGSESESVHRQLARYAKKLNIDLWMHISDLEVQTISQVLGDRYLQISSPEDLKLRLNQAEAQTILLWEGRLPADYEQILLKKG